MGWFQYDENDLTRFEDRYYKLKYSKIPANEEWLAENDESHPEYRHWSRVLKELRSELVDLEFLISEAKRDIEERKAKKKEKSSGWF